MMDEQVNIIIADDHPLIIDGIKSMLANDPRYHILAGLPNGQMVMDYIYAQEQEVHLVITDINMPHMSGIDLCKLINRMHPSIKVLILSMYNNTAVIKQALSAEADGFVLKHAGAEEFLLAVKRIADGGTYFGREILPILYNRYMQEKKENKQFFSLTNQEQDVLTLISREHTMGEIAARLRIARDEVISIRAALLAKMNCSTNVGLVKYAIQYGLA